MIKIFFRNIKFKKNLLSIKETIDKGLKKFISKQEELLEFKGYYVATLALGHSQVNSHFGSWSPGGLPNLQRVIVEIKTPCIEKFFISLESYLSVDN